MKERIFLDTGFWIALFDRRDANHISAKQSLGYLLGKCHLYISEFILFETLTYLNCSIKRHDLAIRFLTRIQESPAKILTVDEGIKTKALELFRKYSDKHLSMTDCTSFVIMSEKGIRRYAGFDDHFRQMGFVCAFDF